MKKSELKEFIKSSFQENIGAEITGKSGKKTVMSFKDSTAMQKFKSDKSNIASVNPLEEEEEEEGIDVSMDKVSKALSAVQKKLDQMFADFKMGKMNKDEYMSKRKDLQAKRDKLNAALMSFEEDEDEI